MRHHRRFALLAAAVALLTAPAAASPGAQPLPPTALIRIPDSAARKVLLIDVNAPVVRGEFASAVRLPSDRAVLHDRIEQQRAAEAARFARGAGPGISVRLRRSKY